MKRLSLTDLKEEWFTTLDIESYCREVLKTVGLPPSMNEGIADPTKRFFNSNQVVFSVKQADSVLGDALKNVHLSLDNQRVIHVDTERSCKSSELPHIFDNHESRLFIERVLTLTCKMKNISYKQGMNDILMPIIYLVRSTSASIFSNSFSDDVLVFLFYNRIMDLLMANLFADEHFFALQSLLEILNILLAFFNPNLFFRLSELNVSPELYASSWILTLFSRVASLDDTLYIWHHFLNKGHQRKIYPLASSLGVVLRNQDRIMKCPEADLPVLMSNLLSRDSSISSFLNDFLNEADSLVDQIPLFFVQLVDEFIQLELIPDESLFIEVEAIRFGRVYSEELVKHGVHNDIILDFRPQHEYSIGHLMGSESCKSSTTAVKILQKNLSINKRIIILSNSIEKSVDIATELLQNGISRLLIAECSWQDIVLEIKEQGLVSSQLIIEDIISEGNIAAELCSESSSTDASFAESHAWIKLASEEALADHGLQDARFFVAKRLLNSLMDSKKCILAVAQDYIVQMVRHPEKMELAKVEERFSIADIVKITSSKEHTDAVIFHSKVPAKGKQLAVTKVGYSVMRSKDCIKLVAEKWKLLADGKLIPKSFG